MCEIGDFINLCMMRLNRMNLFNKVHFAPAFLTQATGIQISKRDLHSGVDNDCCCSQLNLQQKRLTHAK